MKTQRPILCTLALFGLIACSPGDGPDPAAPSTDAPPDPSGDPHTDPPADSALADDTDALPPLRLSLAPVPDHPDRIGLRVDGAPADLADLTLTVDGGSGDPWASPAPGQATAALRPTRPDTALRVTVVRATDGAEAEIEPVALHARDPRWAPAERVPGLVNTPGWEDSSEISPDGQWLIVSTYTPVDAFRCTLTQNDVSDPACNRALGPSADPERPDLPGADRIVSPTSIRHRAPSLCLVGEGGADFPVAMPPTAAYGFRRQPDGSFAEPFPIAYAMDGYSVAPFGLSFVGDLTGPDAKVVYAHADLRDFDTKGLTPNLYTADLSLGQANTLGRFTCPPAQGLQLADDRGTRLALLPHTQHRGNPYLEHDEQRIWYDDEGSDRSLVYTSVREGSGWGPRLEVAAPVNRPGQSSYQPFLHDDRLFWAEGFRAIRSATRTLEAPTLASGWSDDRDDLQLGPATGPPEQAPAGQLVAIGEPSLAVDGQGVASMYFVGIFRTTTDYNADILRVREAP